MGYRIMQWRLQVAQVNFMNRRALHEGTDGRIKRSFVRYNKDGQLLYMIAKKEQGKDLPRQPKPEELFQISNLVLDLDAEGIEGVREFAPEDHERLEEAYALSDRRKAVRDTLAKFDAQIKESREAALETVLNSATPWRITGHDLLSLAFRGSMVRIGSQLSKSEHRNPGYFPLSAITQSHMGGYHPDQTRLPQSKKRFGLDTELTETQNLLGQSAPGRKANFINQVCSYNGIPPHAMADEKLLLRWLMLRRNNIKYTKRERNEPPPTPVEIAVALRKQKSIGGVRRLVFLCFDAGVDFSAFHFHVRGSKKPTNLALEIRGACTRILRETTGVSRYYEALTFVNNLQQRYQLNEPDMEACIRELQLECKAMLHLPLSTG